MKLKHFLGAIAASSLGLSFTAIPQHAQAQNAACPDPSTLTSVATPGDPTSFQSITGGSCSGTPDNYGVTIYKMGFCTSDPTPSGGALPDYSSCSLTFEDSSGSAANFAAGSTFGALPASLSSAPAYGTYGYAIILISTRFNIQAQYGPIAGNTYYSTPTSTGWPASANTTGPATSNPVTANSFGNNCDSLDSLSISAGTLTGTILNSSEERIPDSSTAATCTGATYILGVVALNSPITIDESVTALDATFTVTNNGTTIVIDNTGGIIFDAGPFNVTLNVVRGSAQ